MTLFEQATITAENMAQRVKAAYIASVIKHAEHYTAEYTADEDDFYAWVEGYGWEPAE